jgi:DNA-binding LacI/PurR family transcriptional regulator
LLTSIPSIRCQTCSMRDAKTSAVTMQNVADRAGVSIATVSFVVNSTKNVSPKTRERIETAMRELGFRRNAVARALASRRSHIIALLFPALDHPLETTSIRFVTSAAETASELGYHLVLWPSHYDAEEVRELTGQGLVDGVILMEVLLDDPRVPPLIESNTPFGLIGRTRDPSQLAHVDIDFDKMVEDSVAYLVSLGHHEIAFVIGRATSDMQRDYGPVARTEAAYIRVAHEYGLDSDLIYCDKTFVAGREVAGQVLERNPQTTGILVMNELAAFGIVAGLNDRGLSVPGDISLLSLSTSPTMGTSYQPELSTMDSPGIELGRLAVEALINRLENGPVPDEPQLLPCILTVRETTGPAPTRLAVEG